MKYLRVSSDLMIPCDHTSVGVLVWRQRGLLLIERNRPPYGFAPPAGHVDKRRSFEQAAREELSEEVNVLAVELKLVAEGRLENRCRRPDGAWHYWKIFEATKTQGNPLPNREEARSIMFADRKLLNRLSVATLHGTDDGRMEPAWVYWLSRLGILEDYNVDLNEIGRLL